MLRYFSIGIGIASDIWTDQNNVRFYHVKQTVENRWPSKMVDVTMWYCIHMYRHKINDITVLKHSKVVWVASCRLKTDPSWFRVRLGCLGPSFIGSEASWSEFSLVRVLVGTFFSYITSDMTWLIEVSGWFVINRKIITVCIPDN